MVGRRRPLTDVAVQVRAHGEPVDASVQVDDGELVARLSTPLRGIAAGQSIVVYDGTRVMGQASIARAGRTAVVG